MIGETGRALVSWIRQMRLPTQSTSRHEVPWVNAASSHIPSVLFGAPIACGLMRLPGRHDAIVVRFEIFDAVVRGGVFVHFT